MALRLGKLPARSDARTLRFAAVSAPLRVPARDVAVLHRWTDWGMLGNDTAGDCVWAGAEHETMLWMVDAGWHAADAFNRFSARTALADYAALTGYDPADASTDQGTVVLDALNYRRATGLIDTHGQRHKLYAYAALDARNHAEVKQAIHYMDAVGIGITFPSSAMDQFNAGDPWTIVDGSPNEGGHYIPLVGYDPKWVYCVTWGRVQAMSWGFLDAQCDEAYALLSTEMLKHGHSIEGLDLPALQQALAAL